MNQFPHLCGTRLPMVILFAAVMMTISACAHHHHHYDEDRVAIVDEHGWRHDGYYDADRHWHGGYHDERGEYHEDPRDWHR